MSYENKLTIGFLVHENAQRQLQFSLEGKVLDIADLVMVLTSLCTKIYEIAETLRMGSTNYCRPKIYFAEDDLPLRMEIASNRTFTQKEIDAILGFVKSSLSDFINNPAVQLQIINSLANASV